MTARDVALNYLARGWRSIPIPHRTKRPTLDAWQDLRLDREDLAACFNGHPSNIGVLLGEPSGDLVDLDVDAREAVALADIFLPSTPAVFGRASKRRSHRLYTCAIITEKFADCDGAMLVEIRSTGGQTVFPGSTHPSGERIEWAENGAPARVDPDELRRATTHLAISAMFARHWPGVGVRHEGALAAAGFLARAGVDDEAVVKIIMGAARAAGDDDSRKREALDTIAAIRAGEPATGGPRLAELLVDDGEKAVARLRKWLGADEEQREHFTRTDAGNAQRFARDHGRDARYVYAWSAWLIWDGRRWARDAGANVAQFAKQTARSVYAEAATAADDARRKALAKHAAYSESEPGIRRMLILAQSEPGIPVTVSELDPNSFLLNTPSGTLDVRTVTLHPHRREDLITKITAAPYVPGAHHPVFDAFLARVFPDAAVRLFMQRVAGYCLTGSTSEEKLFLVHGPTAGGKSTLLTALRRALGDYAATAAAETFMERKADGGSPRDDLVKLIGRRCVVSSEVKDGTRLAEALVKTLFGGDDMSARGLYEKTVEFTPTFKLVIAANHRPKVRDDDEALWRRIVEIPFIVSIPAAERDPAVKATLCDPGTAGAALLTWAADGARAWLRDGLGTSGAVTAATADYRRSMDPLSDFIAERCVLADEVSNADLRAAYEAWAKENGVKNPVGGNAFAERLETRGCERSRRHGGKRWWVGIRLRTPADPENGDAGDGGDAHSVTPPYTRAHEESYAGGVSAVSAASAPELLL